MVAQHCDVKPVSNIPMTREFMGQKGQIEQIVRACKIGLRTAHMVTKLHVDLLLEDVDIMIHYSLLEDISYFVVYNSNNIAVASGEWILLVLLVTISQYGPCSSSS